MGLLDLRGNNGIRIWIKDKNLHLIYGNFNDVQKRYYLYTESSKNQVSIIGTVLINL